MISNFIRGIIDGALSTLGVVIGASTGDVSLVIAAGTGGAVANGVSNILGAFTAERAHKYEKLNQIEQAMVEKNLKKSVLEQHLKKETTKAGFVDGFATIIGGMIPVIPFLFIEPATALIVSIIIVLLLLFGLGVYVGKVSRDNMILSGIKLVVFGIITAGMVFVLQNFIVA